jgi:hypothetical protein
MCRWMWMSVAGSLGQWRQPDMSRHVDCTMRRTMEKHMRSLQETCAFSTVFVGPGNDSMTCDNTDREILLNSDVRRWPNIRQVWCQPTRETTHTRLPSVTLNPIHQLYYNPISHDLVSCRQPKRIVLLFFKWKQSGQGVIEAEGPLFASK